MALVYLFIIFNSLQGIVFFLAYFWTDRRVREWAQNTILGRKHKTMPITTSKIAEQAIREAESLAFEAGFSSLSGDDGQTSKEIGSKSASELARWWDTDDSEPSALSILGVPDMQDRNSKPGNMAVQPVYDDGTMNMYAAAKTPGTVEEEEEGRMAHSSLKRLRRGSVQEARMKIEMYAQATADYASVAGTRPAHYYPAVFSPQEEEISSGAGRRFSGSLARESKHDPLVISTIQSTSTLDPLGSDDAMAVYTAAELTRAGDRRLVTATVPEDRYADSGSSLGLVMSQQHAVGHISANIPEVGKLPTAALNIYGGGLVDRPIGTVLTLPKKVVQSRVTVTDVEPSSPYKDLILIGDEIISINGTLVPPESTATAVMDMLREAANAVPRCAVTLAVARQGEPAYEVVKRPEASD